MSLTDKLHDEIDAAEEQVAKARDIIRKKREDDLPEILKLVAENEPSTSEPYRGVLMALEVFAARIAGEMDSITTKTAQEGVAFGRRRNED